MIELPDTSVCPGPILRIYCDSVGLLYILLAKPYRVYLIGRHIRVGPLYSRYWLFALFYIPYNYYSYFNVINWIVAMNTSRPHSFHITKCQIFISRRLGNCKCNWGCYDVSAVRSIIVSCAYGYGWICIWKYECLLPIANRTVEDIKIEMNLIHDCNFYGPSSWFLSLYLLQSVELNRYENIRQAHGHIGSRYIW